jgi:GNAT superfamily N-acetyltransferase
MDFTVTEEMIRNRERWLRETGLQRRAVIAVDESTGDGAGFTDVVYDPKEPHVVQQGGTAVVAAHRGRQIGLWMKAAMLVQLVGEWPKAIFVRTSNANVNEYMLAINERLGFRYAWTSTIWQLPLAQARLV